MKLFYFLKLKVKLRAKMKQRKRKQNRFMFYGSGDEFVVNDLYIIMSLTKKPKGSTNVVTKL